MAEKKSMTGKATPKKRVAKNLEEPKPVSEVQPAVEQVKLRVENQPLVEPVKPREINWDIVGLASVAISLLGAAFFYFLGYSYVMGWYEYYGISPYQLKLPVDFVIVQSIFPLMIIMSVLFLTTMLISISPKVRKSLFEFSKSVISAFGETGSVSRLIGIAFCVILILLLIMGVGISLGHYAGRRGVAPFGSSKSLKQLLLVSSEPLLALEGTEVEITRNIGNSFAYGPFIIIGEDEYSLFLSKQPTPKYLLKQNIETSEFQTSEKPSLYIIPRNGNVDIFLIPVPAPVIPISQPTKSPTSIPTNTAIPTTSTEKPKITSTSTPVTTQP